MRFIKVRSVIGGDYYLNPACIEGVGQDSDGQTKIYMRGDNYYTRASVEDVVKMIVESTPESGHDTATAREIEELKELLSDASVGEFSSIHWPRIYKTAIDIAKYQRDRREERSGAVYTGAIALLESLIRYGSCDPDRCQPIKWH